VRARLGRNPCTIFAAEHPFTAAHRIGTAGSDDAPRFGWRNES